jgi:hypothetical protein
VTVVKKKLEQSAAPVRVGLRSALKQLSSLHPGTFGAARTLVAAKAMARVDFMNILTATFEVNGRAWIEGRSSPIQQGASHSLNVAEQEAPRLIGKQG